MEEERGRQRTFFIYSMLLGGWIIFNAMFLHLVSAFNIFNSHWMAVVHILLAISGAVFLCSGTGGDRSTRTEEK